MSVLIYRFSVIKVRFIDYDNLWMIHVVKGFLKSTFLRNVGVLLRDTINKEIKIKCPLL